MRAISLWQPWASAITLGAKTIETRSWYTSYRGAIAIHAAKRMVKNEIIEVFAKNHHWHEVFKDLMEANVSLTNPLWKILPLGAIVAVAHLSKCIPTECVAFNDLNRVHRPIRSTCVHYKCTERDMGDFTPGRYAWILTSIVGLSHPIPLKGQQGLWSLNMDICQQIEGQLSTHP